MITSAAGSLVKESDSAYPGAAPPSIAPPSMLPSQPVNDASSSSSSHDVDSKEHAFPEVHLEVCSAKSNAVDEAKSADDIFSVTSPLALPSSSEYLNLKVEEKMNNVFFMCPPRSLSPSAFSSPRSPAPLDSPEPEPAASIDGRKVIVPNLVITLESKLHNRLRISESGCCDACSCAAAVDCQFKVVFVKLDVAKRMHVVSRSVALVGRSSSPAHGRAVSAVDVMGHAMQDSDSPVISPPDQSQAQVHLSTGRVLWKLLQRTFRLAALLTNKDRIEELNQDLERQRKQLESEINAENVCVICYDKQANSVAFSSPVFSASSLLSLSLSLCCSLLHLISLFDICTDVLMRRTPLYAIENSCSFVSGYS